MIVVRENKNKDAEQFPITIELNAGKLFFTVRAAKELRDKISSVLANKKGAQE